MVCNNPNYLLCYDLLFFSWHLKMGFTRTFCVLIFSNCLNWQKIVLIKFEQLVKSSWGSPWYCILCYKWGSVRYDLGQHDLRAVLAVFAVFLVSNKNMGLCLHISPVSVYHKKTAMVFTLQPCIDRVRLKHQT